MAVKLKDIAEEAGVSTTTVSLVLNQGKKSRIGEETREKVTSIAQKLGYKPRKLYPSTSKGIPNTIGMIIPNITNSYFAELAGAIENEASQFGYHIMLCNTRRNVQKEIEYLEILQKRQVDGLLINSTGGRNPALQELLKTDIPVVFIGDSFESEGTSTVRGDSEVGVSTAIEYLLSLGHKRIALISAGKTASTQHRLKGYKEALYEAGVKIEESLIETGYTGTIGEGREAIRSLLSHPEPPSAVVSYHYFMTIGALLELKERKLHIPEDISFIGSDDVIWVQLLDSALTTISQPLEEVGSQATQLLIRMIQGWGTREQRNILIKPKLVIRDSCRRFQG